MTLCGRPLCGRLDGGKVFPFAFSPSKRRFMRAEAQNHVDKIQQALALLRRFL